MLSSEKILQISTNDFHSQLGILLDEYGLGILFRYPEIVEVTFPRVTLDIWDCFAGAAVIAGNLWAFHDYNINARKSLTEASATQVAMGIKSSHVEYLVNAMRISFGSNFAERSIRNGWFQATDRMNMIVYPDGSLYYGFGEFQIR